MRGKHTWEEIQSQGAVWQATLVHAREVSKHIRTTYDFDNYSEAIFIGCGSTYYLSISAAALCNSLVGLRARGIPSSEMFLFPESNLPRDGKPVLIAVSRSGETTETIRATNIFKEHYQAPALTIGNYPDSLLVKTCDDAIVIPEGQEESIAQTRSFTSMLVAAEVLLGTIAGDHRHLSALEHLPGAVARIIQGQCEAPQKLGQDKKYDTFIFLGSGPFYGIACEAMLKMKEMSLSHSEAFHYMEFRHGPKSIVNERTLIAAILSDSARQEELKVLREMKGLGATILLVSDDVPAECPADHVVELASGIPELARVPLYLPPLQVLAYNRAIANGLDPDKPTNLDAVVVL